MGNDVQKTSGTTTTADKGVRPEVKIGADFPSSDGSTGSGSWAFSYTPGEKVLAMQVQTASAGMMPPPGPLSMEIEASGVDDIIAWLAGVKNLISQAEKNSNTGGGS